MNRCEEEVNKFNPSQLEFTTPSFYCALDNKLIDTYYASRVDIFTDDEKDLLQPEEFLHYIRQVNKDLEFMLNLKFTHFWGLISKTPEISRFLDEFLQNVRKHNDIYKIQFVTQFENHNCDSTNKEDSALHEQIKKTMNRMLKLVL